MSRKPLEDDAVYGTAKTIAAMVPVPVATLIWLQQQGKLPVTRLQGVWFTNRGALQRAKQAARKRGELWAQREARGVAEESAESA
jgi:hypothetical protein